MFGLLSPEGGISIDKGGMSGLLELKLFLQNQLRDIYTNAKKYKKVRVNDKEVELYQSIQKGANVAL